MESGSKNAGSAIGVVTFYSKGSCFKRRQLNCRTTHRDITSFPGRLASCRSSTTDVLMHGPSVWGPGRNPHKPMLSQIQSGALVAS